MASVQRSGTVRERQGRGGGTEVEERRKKRGRQEREGKRTVSYIHVPPSTLSVAPIHTSRPPTPTYKSQTGHGAHIFRLFVGGSGLSLDLQHSCSCHSCSFFLFSSFFCFYFFFLFFFVFLSSSSSE